MLRPSVRVVRSRGELKPAVLIGLGAAAEDEYSRRAPGTTAKRRSMTTTISKASW